jgi:hypothetical protein
MADHTTLPHSLVLVNKRAALLGVALETGFVSTQKSKAAAPERLLNICRRALDCDALVRLVTISAAHFAFQYWMVVRQLECRTNFQVTLETSLRRLTGVDDRTGATAGFNVQTPGPVARLAAHVLGVFPFRLQSRVRCGSEIAYDLFMAGATFLCADELRAGNTRGCKNRLICFERAARKQNHGERGHSPYAPKKSFALTVDPSS